MPESKDPEDPNGLAGLRSIFTTASRQRNIFLHPIFLPCFPRRVYLLNKSPVSRTILFSLILCQLAGAQGARPGQPPPQVTVTVTDENGAAVIGARILRNDMERSRVFQAETDFRGRARFPAATGPHRLLVEKPGFYSALLPELKPSQPAVIEVTLPNVPAFPRRLALTDSPPAADR